MITCLPLGDLNSLDTALNIFEYVTNEFRLKFHKSLLLGKMV